MLHMHRNSSRAIEDYMYQPYTPYKGREGERESGNGGLMRIAPAIISASSREMAIAQGIQSTLLTHGSQTCVDYSRAFAEELFNSSETCVTISGGT